MNDTEKIGEWVRYYHSAGLKMNALQAVKKNDPKLLPEVLRKLGLESALDVVKACEAETKW